MKGFPEELTTLQKSEERMGFTQEEGAKENIASQGTHRRQCPGTKERQVQGIERRPEGGT